MSMAFWNRGRVIVSVPRNARIRRLGRYRYSVAADNRISRISTETDVEPLNTCPVSVRRGRHTYRPSNCTASRTVFSRVPPSKTTKGSTDFTVPRTIRFPCADGEIVCDVRFVVFHSWTTLSSASALHHARAAGERKAASSCTMMLFRPRRDSRAEEHFRSMNSSIIVRLGSSSRRVLHGQFPSLLQP